MELNWFKDLSALASTGNFSRAAELNHLSQSALSRRIQSLEQWVGTTLVDRAVQPVKLTAAGQQMLEAGLQAINRIETEREQIREALEQPERYVVTFGAQHSIGWRFYPAWLQAFESAFGPIMSRLRADNLPNCLTDLERGEVDLVIGYASDATAGTPGDRDFDAITIGSDQLIPVSRPGPGGVGLYDLDDGAPMPIPYLQFGPAAPIGQHLARVLEHENLSGRLRPAYENSMAGALRIRAREGLGVAWLPRSLVAPDLEAGLLVQSGGPRYEVALRIRLYRRSANRNRLVRRIWDYLAERESAPLIAGGA